MATKKTTKKTELGQDLQLDFSIQAADKLSGMKWSAAAETMPTIVADYLQARFPETGSELLEGLARSHVHVSDRRMRIDFDAIAAALQQ